MSALYQNVLEAGSSDLEGYDWLLSDEDLFVVLEDKLHGAGPVIGME